MNIQLYVYKRNFDVQKAERFLKERRLSYQLVDLKKHRLGRRELELFAKTAGAQALINTKDEAARSHPICYTQDAGRILDYLAEMPQFLKTPIIREGQRVMIGYQEEELKRWVSA